MKRNIFFVALALAAGGAGSACGPAAPDTPTWEADVRPLLQARCLRCHSVVGHDAMGAPILGHDPDMKLSTVPKYSFDYATWAELRDAPMDPSSKLFGARLALIGVVPYVRGELAGLIMPPPPAAHLPAWEIDMLDKWTKNPM